MSLIRVATTLGLALLSACVSTSARADDSWQSVMSRAPSDANVLLMVNAEKVRDSGFAKTAGWNSADAAASGLRSILPRGEVRRALFAARLNLVDLEPQWEAGVLETKSDVPLEAFATGTGAPHELLGTTPGVRLPFNAYLLKLAPYTFGMLGPADRQKAAQWSRAPTSSKLDSAYLMKIASFPETVGTEIMLGIDLTDAVDLAAVKRVMQESPVVREAKLSPDAAAEIIHSIEGMALGVRVLDQASGMIRVDFRRDPASLAPVMKPLLLERLAARGAMIEDFQSWTMRIEGNTAYLGGNLTPAGLSLVLSIVEPELPGEVPAPASAAAPGQSTKSKAEMTQKSQQNFTKVKNLITEVRFPSSDLKIVSAGAFGAWIDRQARRLDQMPILGVDPELVDFTQGVAQSLRTTAAKQRAATIGASASSTRRYRYHDGNQSQVSESDFQIQSRMETASANLSHVDIMRMIDDETATIRRRLTERYQVEF